MQSQIRLCGRSWQAMGEVFGNLAAAPAVRSGVDRGQKLTQGDVLQSEYQRHDQPAVSSKTKRDRRTLRAITVDPFSLNA